MLKILVNDTEYSASGNISAIELCSLLGFYIPRFCYHETLSIAGNCRMCVIEISNSPKPVASCALPIINGIKLLTNSPLVKKARENIIEALLLNHPLDCPICDQAGECDLQDQVKTWGSDRTRFFFNKKVTEDKQCNVLIKTIMTRCIHCTRCVRFNTEISGGEFLGTLNRGANTEIGSYQFSEYSNEISANVIDLCPVGALTAQQYAFKSRPWKLTTVESIDLNDSLCCNVYLNISESDIFKIFPKRNKELNNDLISDKARFSFDANKNNRLDTFIGLKNNLKNLKQLNLTGDKVSFLFENCLDLESLFYLKQLQNNKNNIKLLNERAFKNNFYLSWLNDPVSCISSKETTNCFIIASNIRLENCILNTKLKIKQQKFNTNIFGFSCFFEEIFSIEFLTFNLNQFCSVLESKTQEVSYLIIDNVQPLFIFGENLIKRNFNLASIFSFLKKRVKCIRLIKISLINSEIVDFFNFSKLSRRHLDHIEYLFLLNTDDSFFVKKLIYNKKVKTFKINTHRGSLRKRETTFVPLKTEYEQEHVFCNLEGKLQKTSVAVNTLNKEILDLITILNNSCSLYNFNSNTDKKFLNFIQKLLQDSSLFLKLYTSRIFAFLILEFFAIFFKTNVSAHPLKTEVEDFYLSNKFLKQSRVMQRCSQNKRKNDANFY